MAWSSGRTLATLVLAAVLLATFVIVQCTASSPLLPRHALSSRNMAGADTGALLLGAGIVGIFFFVILWLQLVKSYSPSLSGLLFLPMTALISVSAGLATWLLDRIGPRPLLAAGPTTVAVCLLSGWVCGCPCSPYCGRCCPRCC